MATSRARQVTGTFAELTGRSDDEVWWALIVGAVLAGLLTALRFVNFLDGLGIHRSRSKAA